MLALNSTADTEGKGGDIQLLSGFGSAQSGRAALLSADGPGSSGAVMVRSGNAMSIREAAIGERANTVI